MDNLRRQVWFIVWLTIVVLLSSGCAGVGPGLSPTETLLPSPTITLTPTSISPTPTPLAPIGLLLAPPGTDPQLSAEIQSSLSQWIPEMGYRFQVRPSIDQDDLERDDFILIVALAPYPDIAQLSGNNPEIQFLSIGIQDIEPATNVTTIGADGNRLDNQGFIAGYMAAMITPDWRVGVIGSSISQETIDARHAFFTGVKFYCGLCLPSSPPFYEYPLYFELGADADTAAWSTAADYMLHRSVTTVYVVPGAGDDAMFQQLTSAGVNIIAGQSVSPVGADHWVASLRFDLLDAFYKVWPLFVDGTGSQSNSLPLRITEVNEDLLSPGKQRLVESTLDDLVSGYIDLGISQGENP